MLKNLSKALFEIPSKSITRGGGVAEELEGGLNGFQRLDATIKDFTSYVPMF